MTDTPQVDRDQIDADRVDADRTVLRPPPLLPVEPPSEPLAPSRSLVTSLRRFGGWLVSLLHQTFVEPIHQGRLRDTGWGPGLRSVVQISYGAIVVAAVVALVAGPAREHLPLAELVEGQTIPRAMVWPLLALITLALAVFLLACMHGPVWLTVVGAVVAVPAMGSLGLLSLASGGGLGIDALVTLALMIALLVVMGVWRGGQVRRIEFVVVFALLHAIVLIVAVQGRWTAMPLGFDLLPSLLGLQMGLLAAVALPLTYAAGTAPAEITSMLARRGATLTARWSSGPRVVRVVLAVALVVQLGQAGWSAVGLDPLTQGVSVWLGSLGFVIAITAIGLFLVRRAGRPIAVDDVPETGGAMGWVAGAAVVGMAVPLLAVIVVVVAVVSSVPGAGAATAGFDTDLAVVTARGVVAVIGMVIAVRMARSGRATPAVIVATGSVLLLPPLVDRLLGGQLLLYPDTTVLMIMATAAVAVATIALAVGGRLSTPRVVALLSTVFLLLLVPHRWLIAEPLEQLLDSGAGAILLGVGWQLISSSSVGNRHGGRIGVPCRVLLIMASTLITVLVLAYNALLRNPGLGGQDAVLDLADQTLGVAILTAAVMGCVAEIRRDRVES